MIVDRNRVCELLVGLPDVNVLGVVDAIDGPLFVHIEMRLARPCCTHCGWMCRVKDRPVVQLVDLPAFGRPTVLVWRKHRYECPNDECLMGSWTIQDDRIAAPRMLMTARAGRWVTCQVGEHGRAVSGVAAELDCDWHTVMDTVIAYGTALIDDDPTRIRATDALGLDETLFVKRGEYRQKHWATSIVDVRQGRLIDMIEGRDVVGPCVWLDERGQVWRDQIRYATLDLSSSYRKVFNTMLPQAVQIADPFHVVKLANAALDECRRRVQNDTFGHRGHKTDPLYRARKLLVMAHERIAADGETRLRGLLAAGDPKGEVAAAWSAKEEVRSIYDHHDPGLAVEYVNEVGRNLRDQSCPREIRRLGRTINRWKQQIAAWHEAHLSNAPTKAANNLIKRVKRVVFGFVNFRNYRIRSLLYAGRLNWSLLDGIKPR